MIDVIAVDWSGDARRPHRKIFLAEVSGGVLRRLEAGRDRGEVIEHLALRAESRPDLVVGFDFSFSFPAWFLEAHGLANVEELWRLVAVRGEDWLEHCRPPFWGRTGRPRPAPDPDRPAFRRTESERLPLAGVSPKSTFQIGGAGSVGTGSIRGMPHLLRLRQGGFGVHPFDAGDLPLAVEIYPRYLTGSVNKSSDVARSLYLAQHFPDQPRELVDIASASEDAFDAAVSALCMYDHIDDVLRLPPAAAGVRALEGDIWCPARDPLLPSSWPLCSLAKHAGSLRDLRTLREEHH